MGIGHCILTTFEGLAIADGMDARGAPCLLDQRFPSLEEAQAHATSAGLSPEVRLQTRWVKWIVPAYRVEAIKDLVAEVNRKAAKRGTGGMQVWFGQPEIRKVEIRTRTGCFKADRLVCPMEAVMETPRIAGWHLRTVLDHSLWTVDNPANIVSSIDHEWTMPEAYRSARAGCDHCRTSRQRGKTVILQNDAGDLRQIGLTCLEAYTGKDPVGALFALSSFDQVGRICSDDDWDDGWPTQRVPKAWPLAEFLTATATAIRVEGWLSRKDADAKQRASTADTAADILTAWRRGPVDACTTRTIKEFGDKPTDQDCTVAQAAWEWTKNLPVKTDFDHNIQTIARAGYVTARWIGFAAAMVSCYQREISRQAEEAARAAGKTRSHVGAIGQRLDLDVEVIGKRTMDGYYGACTLLKFVTPDGDLLMTFSSGEEMRVPDGDSTRPIDVGDKIRIRGTVKDHKEFRGDPETVLSRVAIAPSPKAKKPRGKAA